MLDEILVAFASLHLRERLGAGVSERSVVLMAFMGGMLVGLVITERLLARFEPLRLLRVAGGAGAVAYVAWIFAPSLAWSATLLGIVGLVAAPLYPIAQARAYRALPGRSGMVNAAAALFVPLDLTLPFILGLIADHIGLPVALAMLGLQPLGLAVIAATTAEGRRDLRSAG
jgi:fucose permease